MASAKVLATNHTGFTVSDLTAMIGFFTQALGFELISRAPRDPINSAKLTGAKKIELEVAYLRGHGHTIELLCYRGDEIKRYSLHPFDPGSAHLALNVDDLDQAVAACHAAGAKDVGQMITVDQGPNAGNRIIYVGFNNEVMVELIQPAKR